LYSLENWIGIDARRRDQRFNPRGAQVTPRFTGEGDVSAYVRIGGTVDCPAPQVEVQTFDGGVRTREPFYLALWR
jgi:hypothetical protein